MLNRSFEFDSNRLDELEEDEVASPIYWGEAGDDVVNELDEHS